VSITEQRSSLATECMLLGAVGANKFSIISERSTVATLGTESARSAVNRLVLKIRGPLLPRPHTPSGCDAVAQASRVFSEVMKTFLFPSRTVSGSRSKAAEG
jgi:hypothetical protein